jgi:hypothetical protein
VARRNDPDEVEGQDEEFVFHLERGSELLARGDADGARGALERALELRARDAKVLGLLGQACYRLGKYEDAIVAWQRLVDESPAEPAARVNLGLAFLRAGRQSQAVRQLEIALDLNPDHKKAMGYLGLALLESGDPLRAREWFRKAGSEPLVAKCDALLGGAAPGEVEAAGQAEVQALGAEVEEAAPTPVPIPDRTLAAAVEHAADRAPSPARQAAGGSSGPTPELVAWAIARTLAVPEGEPFAVVDGILAVRVRADVRARLAGALAVRGVMEAEPEVKRFRGRATEKPFGEGEEQLQRLRGDAVVLYAPSGRRFTPLRISDAAFLREEALFAIEEPLAFENGRVPSAGAGELNLVHLRGRGAVLMVSAGEPRALEVEGGAPLRLPLGALLGWFGALTPRLVPLFEGGPAEVLAVELSGDGTVLVDPGPAPAPPRGEGT